MASPAGAPPSLAEPLVSLKTSSWQSFIGWVHGAIRALASGLQAEQQQRETDVQELRGDARAMLDRIHRLEARSSGGQPSPSSAPDMDLAQEVRRLEAKLASWREQAALKQGTEEDLLRLRLEALEGESRVRLQPQDLDAEREALQELRRQCETALKEEGRAQHAALQSKLADTADQLRGLLQAHSSAFEERLRSCESRLLSSSFALPVQTPPKAASEASEPKEEPRRPGSTGSGAGAAGGASLESRVARLERNIKAALGMAPPDGRRLEEVASQAMRAQQEAQRLAQRSQVWEARLSALDGLAASMVAGGDAASAAAVEALERRLEQHMDEKLNPLREQLSILEAPGKISAEEKMDRGLLEEVHQDLLFGTPSSPKSREEASDPLALINATIAARASEEAAPGGSTSITRSRTSSEVTALQTKLQALAAQQDDRALRIEQELKLLQQKFFDNAAAQATSDGGGSGSGEAATALAATLSAHDQELKNLAASVQGLQAAARLHPQAAARMPSSREDVSAPATTADVDVKALQARLDALSRQVEAQAGNAAGPASTAPTGLLPAGLPAVAESAAGDDAAIQMQTSTAAVEARASEALQRVAEAERRIFKLADEVQVLASNGSSLTAKQDSMDEAKQDLLEALAPAAPALDEVSHQERQEGAEAESEASAPAQASSREAAQRGLDALLSRLGSLEDKVTTHAESLQRLKGRLEGSESQASSHAAALRDLSEQLTRQLPLAASAATAEEVSAAARDAPALAEEEGQPDSSKTREKEEEPPAQPAAMPPRESVPGDEAEATQLAASNQGLARLLALEDKVSGLASREEVQRLAQSVSLLGSEATHRLQEGAPAEVFQTSVEQTPESTQVAQTAEDSPALMQALRGEVADLAQALASQRKRLDAALGGEETPEEGALHQQVQQLAEALRDLQAHQGSETDTEALAEAKRLASAMEELQRQVEAGLQLQQEVERASASLAQLREKVEDDSVHKEVRRLQDVVAGLERPKSGGLRQEVSKFAESLENLRFRQDDFLVQLKAAKAALQELPALKEEIRAGKEAMENLAQSHVKVKEATSSELHQLTHRLGQLEEKRLKQVVMDVQALQGALVHVQTELQKEVVIPDHILHDIDAKSAARQEAMWAELHKHAETAAHRADQLERSLSGRLVALEHSTNALLQNEAHSREMEREMAKQSEWFAWRIAWLEWMATGEKRSFARPLLPPPATPAATCFKQPMTEDSELWAQEKTGRQRLRRAPLFNLPSAGPANAQRLAASETSPSARTLATSSSAPDLVVGPSTGGGERMRLPSLG